jgi:hypothetical protein
MQTFIKSVHDETTVEMTNLGQTSSFCHFCQAFVRGRIDLSFEAQLAEFALLLSALSIFYQYIIRAGVSPPKTPLSERETPLTKVSDETLTMRT